MSRFLLLRRFEPGEREEVSGPDGIMVFSVWIPRKRAEGGDVRRELGIAEHSVLDPPHNLGFRRTQNVAHHVAAARDVL